MAFLICEKISTELRITQSSCVVEKVLERSYFFKKRGHLICWFLRDIPDKLTPVHSHPEEGVPQNGSIVLKPEQGRDGSPGWQDRRTLLSWNKPQEKDETWFPATKHHVHPAGIRFPGVWSRLRLISFFLIRHVRLLALNVWYHQIYTWWLDNEHIQQ